MKRRAHGSVLIIVLWISLGLAAVALTLGHSMMMANRGAENEMAGRQAEQTLEGGARYVMELLGTETTPGVLPALEDYEAEKVPVGEGTFWILGAPETSSDSSSTQQPVYSLVDEASKLNLNTATRDMLLALPGMTDELAGAIIDWRDADDTPGDGGAESETYMTRQPPYAAKNAPFESVEELALVNGGTWEVLYGEDANLNGLLDPNEDDRDGSAPNDDGNGQLLAGILRYVTAFSRESNKRSDGTARINLVPQNAELTTLLTDKLGAEKLVQVQQSLGPIWTVNSPMDFYLKSGLTAEDFAKIADDITTVPTGDFIEGRVNINTAGEGVLACLPGIGTDKAASVVTAREQRTSADTSIAWLVDAIGRDNALLAGPYITGRTSQVSADIAAVGRNGRGYRRARFVIDASTGTPQIVYRRELGSLGWALGRDVRESLAQGREVR